MIINCLSCAATKSLIQVSFMSFKFNQFVMILNNVIVSGKSYFKCCLIVFSGKICAHIVPHKSSNYSVFRRNGNLQFESINNRLFILLKRYILPVISNSKRCFVSCNSI